MKRKAADSPTSTRAKRARETEPDYCDAQCPRDEHGSMICPAPPDAMESARSFLKECAASNCKTLLVPDKDADGLDAGVIIHRTLTALGLAPTLIDVHLLKKGSSIHSEEERTAMQSKDPKYIVVVDQGSRSAPPVVENPDVKSMIIDHHLSDEFPQKALVVSACHYPPVATSALLTYEICRPLHHDIPGSCGYLCAMGTIGDLGTTLKWKSPFPDMTEVFKLHTKKAISDAVSLINAPRRTSEFDVLTAWEALLEATSPKEILMNERLRSARAEINQEVERHTHTPPKFSKDGKIAVLRINSAAQIHPAGHLYSKALEIVMVANAGYLPGMVNFSCRIARCARSKDPPVNIISSLKAVADLDTTDLIDRMGENFARGHKEASGGIIPVAEFEELMALMRVGEKPDPVEGSNPSKTKKLQTTPQKNNLMNYFEKK
ncbi:MAG: hypothetical protein HETSPECPRED_008633 [Heterodermia speciosa]|uniref:DDH domain-containing protein n=1 Tax=Heterodermia speciosa TaxID=116794 RepID=A0A8H3FYK7_9LECA|nr:MAG: hypothetical protein HETSPECPRED_008633 [Heterodermia speciosa]